MRVFVDTNVLAYRLDPDEPKKQQQAVAALTAPHEFVISTQVLLELFSVVTRRFGQSKALGREVVESIEYETATTDRELLLRAARSADELQLSIFDALIVVAAAQSGCDELWTEDLTDGQVILGVRVHNPFG